jgi:transmembrane sensor
VSDLDISSDADSSAIARRAADWVSAKHSPIDWSDERQAELDAWVARSLAHRVAYLRIDAAWQRAQRLAALRTPERTTLSNKGWRVSLWRRVAIVVGLLAVLGVFANQFLRASNVQLIETPLGGHETVTLADGSQIELNTETAVKVDFRAHSRLVKLLKGEAYFAVKHDAARPFAVLAGDRRIVDIGTKFVVRLAQQDVKVSLLEGKASLENTDKRTKQPPVVLSAGDVVIATANATHVTKKTTQELADNLAWRRGSVVFHYERVDAAVAELNRYGGPRLVVADADTAKLLISGTFLTNRPEDFAGVAHEIFGLHIGHQNGDLVLSR